MTSRRKIKKETAKLMAKLLAMHTHCKVRHYSREAKLYKEYLRQRTTWHGWKQYAEERLDDWQREISSDRIRGCFDVPELKYSRERAINGTGYGWLLSDGKSFHASCLGVSPALVYGPPTLSSLADSRCSISYLHNPFPLSTDRRKNRTKILDWRRNHRNNKNKRK